MADTIHTFQFESGAQLAVCRGDLTHEATDAVVNAANSQLAHGGGVAAAIARAGGETVVRESREWIKLHGPVSHEQPAVTSGGDLACRYIIHAVGPVWGEGDEDRKLGAAITSSLKTASDLGLESISLPAISTGIFGFPKDRAAGIFMNAVREFTQSNPKSTLKRIQLVLMDSETLKAFSEAFLAEFVKSGEG